MAKSASGEPLRGGEAVFLVRAVVRDDAAEVAKLLAMSPSLVREPLAVGATRAAAAEYFFEEIHHYLIAGDTPLHAAAAGYRKNIVEALIRSGAEVNVRNRRGQLRCTMRLTEDLCAAAGTLSSRPT